MMTENFKQILHKLQEKQNHYYSLSKSFDAHSYIFDKAEKINEYFTSWNLDSCVVAISGGIDSAVCYYIMLEAMKHSNSPIKKVVPVLMPIYANGSTGQQEATEHALLLKNVTVDDIYDLSTVHREYLNINNKSVSDWTNGQLLSLVRTPFIYFKAAELQSKGYKSIVIGTTNLSEAGYIGFYGKASDYMCDLFPIIDLYKSEVFEVANRLNVPIEITKRTPKGDVYNGRNDEEMIGTPYWFLELYMRMIKENYTYKMIDTMLTLEEIEIFNIYKEKIDKLHETNKHKYIVGCSGVKLDIINQF
jgi:NAD+ synthetase